MARRQNAAATKRIALRDELWPGESGKVWQGPDETGYFCAPRTLPLFLSVMQQKAISGSQDPAPVYVELMSRNMGEGIIVMVTEDEHAYASGYTGNRATRTWRDRMKILEERGFIKIKSKGGLKYGYVLLFHPTIVVQKLKEDGKIPEEWWKDWWVAYRSRQLETGERQYEYFAQSEPATDGVEVSD